MWLNEKGKPRDRRPTNERKRGALSEDKYFKEEEERVRGRPVSSPTVDAGSANLSASSRLLPFCAFLRVHPFFTFRSNVMSRLSPPR